MVAARERAGLQERIDDARFLWRSGRREGAFLLALVAIAARARLEHPSIAGDRERFERFLRSRLTQTISLEFRGEMQTWQHLFYKWMRCTLVHEGGLPIDIAFMEGVGENDLMLRAGGGPDFKLLVSPGWLSKLLEWAVAPA